MDGITYLFGKSIALPLNFTFQSILNDEVFPHNWKKVIFHSTERTVKI